LPHRSRSKVTAFTSRRSGNSRSEPAAGNLRWQGFRRFLDVLETTGQRPQPGSTTSFNQEIARDLKAGSVAGDMATAAKTGGLSLVKRFTDFRERLNLGQNTAQIAAILTRPDAGRVLARLARRPVGSSRAGVLALRLSYIGRQAGGGSSPAEDWQR
jgi:hypothetical protein